ncbi:protein Mo25 [Sesamum alatum]|uniref:Protein Mo25 n=1 Tax=Sesamum alatum TaxID=300844 RepID=A0AAE2CKQ2_9LAMI|nr:protein Mo25 [Sesamum alatum]
MSFSFFKQSRPKTPQELAKAVKDSLMALDSKTVAEVKALEKALEEVEKNIVTMRTMLSGDGEIEPSADQVAQLTLEICNEDVISLLFHKLPTLGWETRKNLVHCWSVLLKQKVDSVFCCAQYMEKHLELLDFLVVCYDNKEIALTCGHMLRECIKLPTLAKYILESPSFELFFKFVELPNFDIASDAFSTFKDLLTKHATAVSEFLATHYNEFFEQYEKLLTSANYVTRRQSLKLLSEFLLESPNSNIMKRYIAEVRHLKVMMTLLKDSSKNIQISAFHIFKVFVANPNKPRDIKVILAKNHEKLLALLHSLSAGKGAEDDQFEEEKELIIKEIERYCHTTHVTHNPSNLIRALVVWKQQGHGTTGQENLLSLQTLLQFKHPDGLLQISLLRPYPDPQPRPISPSTPTAGNHETNPPPNSSWGFGSTLLRTIASKSESLLDNYYKDLQEFSSGLQKETSVIRQVASRAVQDLPARLESGAAIAQESLEAVGQAIDNVGSTVSEIIGKDLNFATNDGFSNSHLDGSSGNRDKDLNFGGNAKPYNRVEALIRGLQCNIRTYCDEVEESDYNEWRMGFRVEEKREEIERLVEENGVIKEIYDEIVPKKVDDETFWCRYFYRVDKVVKAEEARARIVRRAISAEDEEELSWDVDDDDYDNDEENGEWKSKDDMKKEVEEKGKGVGNSQAESGEKERERDDEDAGVSRTKSVVLVDEENLEERLTCNEKEGSEGKLGSDISVISSQRSSHAEDDLGWDEIEDIGSGDESKVGEHRSPSPSNAVDLRKRLSVAEEDEELTWDIEDDVEPVKS